MSFCRDAALMSMRKVIKDKSPEEIKLLSKNDLEKPVTMDDFNEGNLLKGIVNCQGVQVNDFQINSLFRQVSQNKTTDFLLDCSSFYKFFHKLFQIQNLN